MMIKVRAFSNAESVMRAMAATRCRTRAWNSRSASAFRSPAACCRSASATADTCRWSAGRHRGRQTNMRVDGGRGRLGRRHLLDQRRGWNDLRQSRQRVACAGVVLACLRAVGGGGWRNGQPSLSPPRENPPTCRQRARCRSLPLAGALNHGLGRVRQRARTRTRRAARARPSRCATSCARSRARFWRRWPSCARHTSPSSWRANQFYHSTHARAGKPATGWAKWNEVRRSSQWRPTDPAQVAAAYAEDKAATGVRDDAREVALTRAGQSGLDEPGRHGACTVICASAVPTRGRSGRSKTPLSSCRLNNAVAWHGSRRTAEQERHRLHGPAHQDAARLPHHCGRGQEDVIAIVGLSMHARLIFIVWRRRARGRFGLLVEQHVVARRKACAP